LPILSPCNTTAFFMSQILHIHNPALEDGWSAPRSGHVIPGDDPVTLYNRLGDPRGR